jgi:hypothetical protein
MLAIYMYIIKPCDSACLYDNFYIYGTPLPFLANVTLLMASFASLRIAITAMNNKSYSGLRMIAP